MVFNSIFVLLAAITSLTYAQSKDTITNCTIFTWDKQPAYLQYYPAQRVSAASTCPPSSNDTHTCPLTAAGDLLLSWEYNITGRDSYWLVDKPFRHQVTFYHSLISAAINESLAGTPWNESVIGIIDTVQAQTPNTSAYLDFAGLKRCFAGTFSNCTGDLADGTPVEACAPVYHTTREQGSMSILDGNYSRVEIPQANVSKYSDPFAHQARGDGGFGASAFAGRSIVAATGIMMIAFGMLM